MSAINPIQALAAKSQASAAPADQPQDSPAPQQAAPDQPTPETDSDSNLPEESAAPVQLHREFSRLNEALTKLADEAGVKRSATIPYIHGQETHEHIQAVGQALQSVGGLTKNILTTQHHADGRGYGSGDGHTVAFPADKLKETILPKDDENAIAAIRAARILVNKVASLLGNDEPAVKVAKSQIQLVGKNNGSGMTVLDLMVALINIVNPPIAAVARSHSGTKEGGHGPHLRAPGSSKK